jgi:hypothetical protein
MAQNLDFFGRILSKTEQKHTKYLKITEFQNQFGP